MNILSWLKTHRVAVLKGGWSRERPISLKTGAAVEASFKRMGVKAHGIDVDRQLLRHLQKEKIDFCFIALHGAFGEDGQVQNLLEFFGFPYTGSGPCASALAMDKHLSKKSFVKARVPTPPWITVKKHDLSSPRKRGRLDSCFRGNDVLFVKPYDQGSAIGVSKVSKFSQLSPALKRCFALSEAAIVEKFVPGRELTVGILGKKVLPVVEIIPEHAFYDYHSKYAAGGSRHIVPADLPKAVERRAQQISLRAFHALGCSVYGRVDLLLDQKGGLHVLEVNTIPGMTATSLLPDAARAAGLSFDDLVLKICELSLREKRV